MSGEALRCSGCATTLTLPTTKQAAAGWRRHSLQWDCRLHFAYTCPTCPESAGLAVLEAMKR